MPIPEARIGLAMSSEAEQDRTDEEAVTSADSYLDGLWPVLKRLDQRLRWAMDTAKTLYQSDGISAPYRGLYISEEEAESLLTREPGRPMLKPIEKNPKPDKPKADKSQQGPTKPLSYKNKEQNILPLASPAGTFSRLDWLGQNFSLSPFDLDLIIIALAPEIDLRYERLYAFLQDNVTRKRPCVDLALNLLCLTPEEKIKRRCHLNTEAPLIRHNILHLIPDPNQPRPLFLSHSLKLDEQIIGFLLEQQSLDSRLAGFCHLVEPGISLNDLPVDDAIMQYLHKIIARSIETPQPLRLYFQGLSASWKSQAAEALAGELGMPLLSVNLSVGLTEKRDSVQVFKLLFREAWFQNSVLYFDNLDTLRLDEYNVHYQHFLDALIEDGGVTILSGLKPWVPDRGSLGVITVHFATPEFSVRRNCWQSNLEAAGIPLNNQELDALAGRFRLSPGQIAEATATALNHAGRHTPGKGSDLNLQQLGPKPGLKDLFAAARLQTGHDLAALAQKIKPHSTWNDIVLPDDDLAQLHEICSRVIHSHLVLKQWGFDCKFSYGKGINALFAGPSGTGKTMAAEIIANELGFDLYKIDLSGVVSKYIGETEKNLNRIFYAAEKANAILFFDEADALFGKRSEVRDSHDRYANIEISYLLQKMEAFDGVTILATNLRKNLDDAFLRRLAFTIQFPFPDQASRLRIWKGIWPVAVPLAPDVDLEFLARQFKLSGGNIKNIALASAFLAAEAAEAVSMRHILQALRREYQKMGKAVNESELKVPGSEGCEGNEGNEQVDRGDQGNQGMKANRGAAGINKQNANGGNRV